MIKKATILALAVLLVATLTSCASKRVVVVRGPHAFDATIKGRVVHGAAGVPAVRVGVSGYGQSVHTGDRGYFTIHFRASVPVGQHNLNLKLTASKPGWHNRSVVITVHENRTTSVKIGLKPR